MLTLSFFFFSFTHTHTHTYIYIYVCVCVCVSPCLYAARHITNLSFCTTYRASQQHSLLRMFTFSGFKSRSVYSCCN